MAEPIPPPDVPNHTVTITAQPEDIDDLGHVSNLVYLRWVQEVAQAHSTAVGWDHPQYRDAGAVFVVRRHEIDYVMPVFAGDRLELVTWLGWWKLASSERRTAIRRVSDGAIVARASTLWAFVDYTTGKPRKIPDSIRAAFGVPLLAVVALLALVACGPKDPPRGAGSSSGGGIGSSGGGSSGGGGSTSGGGLTGDAQAILDEHNRYRAEHCAGALTWSDELAAVAQTWADSLRDSGCAFEHSGARYGENLAAGSTGWMPPSAVVSMWYREVDLYDYAGGGFSMETGHFTQLVWLDTQRLGCGMSQCNDMDVWVCNYDPPGNVYGEFQDKVKAPGC